MKSTLVLFFLLLIIFPAEGQTVKKKYIRGTYSQSVGEPARTFQSRDGSYISIPPLIYSQTTLKLKRAGRAKIQTSTQLSSGLNHLQKGRWKLDGDTLILIIGNERSKYLIGQADQKANYLKNIDGEGGFSREY